MNCYLSLNCHLTGYLTYYRLYVTISLNNIRRELNKMNIKKYMKEARLTPDNGDRIEYMSLRDKMASNALVNSQRNIPGVACNYDADITRLLEVFEKLKNDCGYRLTLNALMTKILVEGLKEAPRLNAHFIYNHLATAGKLIIKKHIDVSMAICLDEDKTFQIKIMHLEDKTLKETALLIEDAKRRLEKTDLDDVMFEVSRQRLIGELTHGRILSPVCQTVCANVGKGKVNNLAKSLKSDFLKIIGKKPYYNPEGLRPEELNEGSVCFTNWGTLYDNLNANITYVPPIYPQMFMFGVGRTKDMEHVYKDENGNLQLTTKKILPLSLIFDHKIGGAADIMPFIRKLDEIFENPEIILTW